MDSSSQGNMSNWSCSQGSHTTGDVRQIQAMKDQNDHLRQMVNQLQSTIDTQNDQLAQALETAATVTQLHEQNTNLKLKLQEVTESSNRTKRSLKAQIIELTNKSEEEKIHLTQQVENANREIAQLKKRNQETTKERDSLAEELDETKMQLKLSVEKGTKLAKQHAKSKDKTRKLLEQLGDLTEKYSQLNSTQEQLALENKEQSEKISALREEIESIKNANNQLNQQLKEKTEECDNYDKAIKCLQDELSAQRTDLTYMSEEREKLLTLVQKMHATASLYETEMETMKTENASLQVKAKKATQLTAALFNDTFNFEGMEFPFDDDLKARIDRILSFDHFQGAQKVQLIINECAKDLNKLHNQVEQEVSTASDKVKAYEDIRKNYCKTYDLLNSVLREWKNFECNEHKIDVVAFCDQDENFLNFLAEECVKLQNLPEAAEFLGPLFVAAELFSDEAYDQRRAIVQNVAETNKDLSTLISAMFLINGRLKKEVATLTKGVTEKAEVTTLLQQLGVEDFSQLPALVESLQSKVGHLKDTRREVHTALVAARDAMNEKEKEESTLRTQIINLRKRIEELERENAQLKGEIEETKTSFYNKEQQLQAHYEEEITKQKVINQESQVVQVMPPPPPPRATRKVQTVEVSLDNSALSSSASQISAAQSTSAAQESELGITVKNMQRSIQEKILENENLKSQIEVLKQQAENTQQQTKKEAQKNEQALRSQIRDLEEELRETQEKLAKTRRRAKNVVKDLKSQHETELNTVASNFETAKAEITDCLTDSKNKEEKAKAVIKQLQDALAESESKMKEMADENVRLNGSLQNLELKISTLQEQFARDQKASQAATAVKMLNIETQHQKEQKEAKAKYEVEKQKAIDFFTHHLGALYHIADLDYDEQALTHLFARLQADLGKLKYFQEQATKL